ncbi:MAG TPA: glutathione peroxidase, partial [Cellvibrionaceae bacterium]|nr:glutathione peroxidase [Cellvibrionaceae bacterium]
MIKPAIKYLGVFLSSVIVYAQALSAYSAEPACPEYLNQTLRKLHSKDQLNLCSFYRPGAPILIVNTASHCGYTKQFKGLETLYQTYKDQGLVVLGF